jgi:LmbE family N-acetylglucosaminyl deacetylase
MRQRSVLVIAALAVLVGVAPSAQLRVSPVGERPDVDSLGLILRRLGSTGTFMETDAHPDDEDNALLSMLRYGQGMRTVLVTATRGNGGQNEIGPELFEPLGVLRTEELLAVHRFDGAEQLFTRAIDFGFSFSIEESIEKWGHDAIVGDLVRQIRTVRPDVIAGFLCGGEGGGQHHQASAQLTVEAFRAAGDPTKYPEQITEGLRPWQAARVFCTDTSFGPQSTAKRTPDLLTTDVSTFDPLIGRTYAELGLEARSMHKCQGTSQLLLLPGQTPSRTYRLRDSILDKDGVAPKSMFEGIDVGVMGLARFGGAHPVAALTTGLQKIAQAVADAQRAFASTGAAAAVPALLAGRQATLDLAAQAAMDPDILSPAAIDPGQEGSYELGFRLNQKLDQFDEALLAASGIRVEALADDGVVTPGQSVTVSIFARSSAPDAPVLQQVTLSGFEGAPIAACEGPLSAGKAITCKTTAKIPAGTHYSTPYWTPRKDAARYDFEPDVPFGAPFRPSPFRVKYVLKYATMNDAERITIQRPVEFRYSDVMAGEKRMDLKVAPAFNVRVSPDIAVIPQGSGARRDVRVTVTNNEKGATSGAVTLQVPSGWTADPASAPMTCRPTRPIR